MRLISLLCVTAGLILYTKALPQGWAAAGCWLDSTGIRTLSAAIYFDSTFNTQEACINFCDERHYTIAGVEFGDECYCDDTTHNNATQQAPQGCNVPCTGDATETCGGADRLTMFTKTLGPTVVRQFSGGLPGVWNLVGSFNNTTPNSEPFAVEAVIAGTTTTSGSVENCLDWCFKDFNCPLCSISDGGVCECGNTLSPTRIAANAGQAVCPRNSSEICGDTGIWQVYQFTHS